jgi:beta-xylosidase
MEKSKTKYYCNPLNVNYRYQFNADPRNSKLQIAREAADPSLILFKGRYYIFASMQLSVWVSDDLVKWESHRLPKNLPLYDYAPDVCVIGEYVYFSASKRGEVCNFYRTKDILNGPYEEIEGSFDFWDPDLFCDDDGRVYFYWGCSNSTPMWGVEMDAKTMLPIAEKRVVAEGNAWTKGYERCGENHSKPPKTEEEVEIAFQHFMAQNAKIAETAKSSDQQKNTEFGVPTDITAYIPLIKGMLSDKPYIEGAWMNKHEGKYYLQYAFAGTQYNIYGDGVLVGDSPLGPFHLADNNPFSYKPGGFIPGAGHGSTMADKMDNMWHVSTMRISMNHPFERRVGLWPAGFDADGELFCNQRYGDWPMAVEEEKMNPWKNPEWFMLSAGKTATASSYEEGKEAGKVTEENVQTWWRAASNQPGEWVRVDLGESYDVHAIQVNFADDEIQMNAPGKIQGTTQARYIEEQDYVTRWVLEGSVDGEHYFLIQDKSKADTDLPHDLVVTEAGIQARFIRLTVFEVPYKQNPCISGIRVFGVGKGEKASVPEFIATRISNLDMEVQIKGNNAVGFNILWGSSPEKLYHSYMVFSEDRMNCEQKIGALVTDNEYYVRVDAFNESGITEGNVIRLK